MLYAFKGKSKDYVANVELWRRGNVKVKCANDNLGIREFNQPTANRQPPTTNDPR